MEYTIAQLRVILESNNERIRIAAQESIEALYAQIVPTSLVDIQEVFTDKAQN